MLRNLISLCIIYSLVVFVVSFNIIERSEWGAVKPKSITPFTGPSPYVIIHHSYSPPYCNSTKVCKNSVKSIQNFHMNEHGWNDIGYSYLIGGDGNVYVGRGFNVVGAHAPNYNSKSVGICIIGNYMDDLPPENMLQATKDFIEYGVSKGYIDNNYKLLGHRQVRSTDCPGDKLFNEIKTWTHFSPQP